MIKIAEFTLSGLPKLVNEIGHKHWTVKHKNSKYWNRVVVDHCILKGLFGLDLERAALVLVRSSTTEPDADNLAGSFKPVIDGLKKARVIKDDNPKIIGTPKFLWEKGKRSKGFIKIEIYTDQELVSK